MGGSAKMGVYLGKPVMIEVPPYSVIARSGIAEIRRYDACVVASVRSKGGELKGGDGFRMLARYIGAFGTPDNEGATGKPEAIKMTAPVVTGTEEDDGNCTDEYVNKKEALLREALPLVENGKTYKAKDGAKRELARYNDPFTPWFLRTNELWIEVDEEENRD